MLRASHRTTTSQHPPRCPRGRAWFVVPCAILLALTGCRGNRSELVESELRKREADLLEYRAENNRLQALNAALMREVQATRPGFQVEPAPQFQQSNSLSYSVNKITLGRLTGGYDDDGWPGDEALEVALEPRDPDDHVIKAPGTLCVTVLAIDPQGQKVPFSSWTVSPDELRKTWRSGLLGTSYHVILPWKSPPPSKKLRIIARFTLPDGRTLEADKDVTIRPPTEVRQVPAAPPIPDGGPQLEEAPLPNGVPEPQAQKPRSIWQRLTGTSAKPAPQPIAESKPVESLSPASGAKGDSFLNRVFGNVGKRPDWWKGDAPAATQPSPAAAPLDNGFGAPATVDSFRPAAPASLMPAQPLGRPTPVSSLGNNPADGPELIRVSDEQPAADDGEVIWKSAAPRR